MNCNCRQCQSIRYALAVIAHDERGGGLRIDRVLKRLDVLHPIAKHLLVQHFQWTFTEVSKMNETTYDIVLMSDRNMATLIAFRLGHVYKETVVVHYKEHFWRVSTGNKKLLKRMYRSAVSYEKQLHLFFHKSYPKRR